MYENNPLNKGLNWIKKLNNLNINLLYFLGNQRDIKYVIN